MLGTALRLSTASRTSKNLSTIIGTRYRGRVTDAGTFLYRTLKVITCTSILYIENHPQRTHTPFALPVIPVLPTIPDDADANAEADAGGDADMDADANGMANDAVEDNVSDDDVVDNVNEEHERGDESQHAGDADGDGEDRGGDDDVDCVDEDDNPADDRASFRMRVQTAASELASVDPAFKARLEEVQKLNASDSSHVQSGSRMSEMKAGADVEAWWGGSWHHARITTIRNRRISIRFDRESYSTAYPLRLLRLPMNEMDTKHSSTRNTVTSPSCSSSNTTNSNDRDSGSASTMTDSNTQPRSSQSRSRKRRRRA